MIRAPAGNVVVLTFTHMALESVKDCSPPGCDTLAIHDGSNSKAPLLGRFSGIRRPEPVRSTGSEVFLQFQTDAGNHGFRAQGISLDPGFFVEWAFAEDMRCNLPPQPSCSYWATDLLAWVEDGEMLHMDPTGDDGHVQCAFHHLTSFGELLGPPVETNELSSLRDTFDLSAFASQNPFGLAVSCLLLLAALSATAASFASYRRDVIRSRGDRLSDLMASGYGQVRTAFRDQEVWGARQLPYRFRVDWQCGALTWPLPGDPLSRAERALMLFTSLLCKLFFTLLFFRSGEGYTDFCDAHGTCTTFMCNLDECAICGACGTEDPEDVDVTVVCAANCWTVARRWLGAAGATAGYRGRPCRPAHARGW